MTQGEKIAALRKEHGLTLEEVGSFCGVSKTSVHKWENGAVGSMRQDHAARLAELFGVTAAELMGEDEAPESREFEIVRDRDLRMIARAGKKMTPDDRATLITIMKLLHPEAFEDDDA